MHKMYMEVLNELEVRKMSIENEINLYEWNVCKGLHVPRKCDI